MGIQNIINNVEEEASTQDMLPENENILDLEDDPVVVNIYSDSSTDTESYVEIIDCWNPSFVSYSDRLSNGLSNSINDAEESVAASNVLEQVEKMQTNLLRKMQSILLKSRPNMGKKKARRFENARQLDLLVGEESLGGCDINDFMPVDCSFRFSQILEDHDLTNKILNPAINSISDEVESKGTDLLMRKKKPKFQKNTKISAEVAFNNLDPSEKILFHRRHLPMGMVQYLDTCIYSFFENNPTGTYVSEPLSSFERFMLHSIAHYYDLNSSSYNVHNRSLRFTKITNNYEYFNPPCLCLSRYLEERLSKNCSVSK